MSQLGLDLRPLIADAVKDVVRELVAETVAAELRAPARPAGAPQAPPPAEAHETGVAGSEYVTAPALRTRDETVELTTDADLDAFVRRLLALFENPKNRQDIRAGRLRFRLRTRRTPGAPAGPALLVRSGAVTERQVAAAHEDGKRIVLGARAVLTPLGREKARALGVTIEKER
ncbi:hypothetical protein [Nocardioides maradonensis]